MTQRGPQLPAVVHLPDAPTIAASALRAALGGVSRTTASNWTRNHGLPPSRRAGPVHVHDTDDVERFCLRHGAAVARVPVPPPPPPAPPFVPWPPNVPRPVEQPA